MRRRWWLIVAAGVIAMSTTGHAAWQAGLTADTPAERTSVHPRTVSIVAVGDWLPESRVNAAAAAFAAPGVRLDHVPMLAPIQPIVQSADLAICHMETPIGQPGARFGFMGRAAVGGYSLISAPYEVAGDLRRLGFDRCSTASNHSWDLGADGIASTLAALDVAGISHVGTARSEAEAAARVQPIAVNDVRISHLSYALNSNVGFPRDLWRLDRATDLGAMLRDVDTATAQGADLIVVSLHVHIEIQSAPAVADRALVESLTRQSEVDLVVIHGPHTIQPLEIVNGTPVFWSLGNLVSGMGVPGRGRYSDLRTLDGLLAAVRFTERPDGRFTAEAAPVLLCQMSASRIVYPGVGAPSSVVVPPADLPGIGACLDRSIPVVAGLR